MRGGRHAKESRETEKKNRKKGTNKEVKVSSMKALQTHTQREERHRRDQRIRERYRHRHTNTQRTEEEKARVIYDSVTEKKKR